MFHLFFLRNVCIVYRRRFNKLVGKKKEEEQRQQFFELNNTINVRKNWVSNISDTTTLLYNKRLEGTFYKQLL